MGEGASLALVSFGASAGLAVFAVLLALAARPGERGWGGRTGARLERLTNPSWLLRRGWHGRGGRPGIEDAGAGPVWVRPVRLAEGLLVTGVGAVLGFVLFGGAVPGVVAGVVAVWAWGRRLAARGTALRRRFQEGLEGALETMVASFKAGQGLVQALEEAARQSGEPLRSALGGVLSAYRAGTPLATALEAMRVAWPLPEVGYLTACLSSQVRTGGDVTALLVNLGGVLRERHHLARDLATRAGEARSTATVLALLPPALLAYILWCEPSQLDPLLTSAFGLIAAGFSAACWLAGVVLTARMLGRLTQEIEGEG